MCLELMRGADVGGPHRHVLMVCPLHTSRREALVRRTDTEEMWRMSSTPEKAQATARWFRRDPPAIQPSEENRRGRSRDILYFNLWRRRNKTLRKYGNNGLKERAEVSAEPAPAGLDGQGSGTTGFPP